MAFTQSERSKRYRERHPERMAGFVRDWAQNNKAARNEYMKKWWREARAKNPEKYRMMLRERRLKRVYGITHKDYEALLLKQNGVCALCGTSDPGDKRFNIFHVDHCHETGRIRGLLCRMCNHALGWLGDNVESVGRVLEYLKNETDAIPNRTKNGGGS